MQPEGQYGGVGVSNGSSSGNSGRIVERMSPVPSATGSDRNRSSSMFEKNTTAVIERNQSNLYEEPSSPQQYRQLNYLNS